MEVFSSRLHCMSVDKQLRESHTYSLHAMPHGPRYLILGIWWWAVSYAWSRSKYCFNKGFLVSHGFNCEFDFHALLSTEILLNNLHCMLCKQLFSILHSHQAFLQEIIVGFLRYSVCIWPQTDTLQLSSH